MLYCSRVANNRFSECSFGCIVAHWNKGSINESGQSWPVIYQTSEAGKLFLGKRFVGELLINSFLHVIDHLAQNDVLSLELLWLIDNTQAHIILSHKRFDA